MNGKTIILGGLCLTTALITSVAVSTAQAGFQWNPPARAAAAPAPNAMAAAPAVSGPLTPMPGEAGPIAIEPLSEGDMMEGAKPVVPVTTTNANAGMKTLNMSGAAPQNLASMPESVESDLLLPLPGSANSPAMNASSMPPVDMTPSAPAAVVEGFGKDIPLAVALRQIVPPAYNISFASGLDQGKPISWNGGMPWPDVVNTMLSSRQLHATLNNNTLNIAPGGGADLVLPASSVADLPIIVDDSKIAGMDVPVGTAVKSVAARPVLNLSEQKNWTAKPGQGLRATLQQWSQSAHVELAWQDVPDSPISSAFSYNGTFDQAVDSLLSLYSGDANEPHGKLYPNLPEGPSVLVVSSN